MSRSYRKFPSHSVEHEFIPPNWSRFRSKERKGLGAEIRALEYGDVIFPRYYGSEESSWFSSHRWYDSLNNTRIHYFTEIRNILNGYTDYRTDWEADFIDAFEKIKGIREADSRCFQLGWLNLRGTKQVIKHWKGDPLDVLYYLTRYGLIEKAVRVEQKRMLQK